MRQNRATIKDEGLGAAFKEGVNEGFRLTGHVHLSMKIGNKEQTLVVKASEVPDHVANFLDGLRGEHYEVGIVIRIIAEGDVKSEPVKAQARKVEDPALGESGIEEAEIVDG